MPARPAKRRVDVRVFPPYRAVALAAWARRAAAAALAAADPHGERGASVVIADDDTLLDLNRRFRGLDEVTDVLSFGERGAASEEESALPGGSAPSADIPPVPFPSVPFPPVPGETPSLGEVVLSYPYAARQAASRNAPVEREVALLIVHGVLHLLGHDHAEPDEESAMRAAESDAMAALFPSAAEGAR